MLPERSFTPIEVAEILSVSTAWVLPELTWTPEVGAAMRRYLKALDERERALREAGVQLEPTPQAAAILCRRRFQAYLKEHEQQNEMREGGNVWLQ